MSSKNKRVVRHFPSHAFLIRKMKHDGRKREEFFSIHFCWSFFIQKIHLQCLKNGCFLHILLLLWFYFQHPCWCYGWEVRAFYKWGKWEFHIEILLSVLERCEGIQDVSFGNTLYRIHPQHTGRYQSIIISYRYKKFSIWIIFFTLLKKIGFIV